MFVYCCLSKLKFYILLVKSKSMQSGSGYGFSTWIVELKRIHFCPLVAVGFPGGLDGKVSACHAGDLGSILGSGRSPGEGNGNPLQYSCL